MKKSKLQFPTVSVLIRHSILILSASLISSGMIALLDYGMSELISRLF